MMYSICFVMLRLSLSASSCTLLSISGSSLIDVGFVSDILYHSLVFIVSNK